ncbi:MAG: acyl--CoA ligase, partial [Lentisphaerae bacterium]|nr:acyl--CoA ligase [Lentisphaerota bacterium]
MRTLATLLEQACSTYGEGIFLVYPTGADDTLREQSYAEFLAGVQTWAAFLTARGVQPGDRVGIITPKSPAQIQALYAAWWAGAIAVPICETLGDLEMGFIIRDSEPRLLLIDASMRSKASANCGDVPVHEFDDLPAAGAASACPSPVARQEEDVAALIYTSGSTGMPKGVMLTHRNLYVNA